MREIFVSHMTHRPTRAKACGFFRTRLSSSQSLALRPLLAGEGHSCGLALLELRL